MKRYLYDEITKEYIKPIIISPDLKKSRQEGKIVYFVPPNSTNIEPLNKKRGYKIIFKEVEWVYEKINKRISNTEIDELRNILLNELEIKYKNILENPIRIKEYYFNFQDLNILKNLNNEYLQKLEIIKNQINSNELEIQKNPNIYYLKEHRLKLLKEYKNQKDNKITFTLIYRIVPNILPIQVTFKYDKFYEYFYELKNYIKKINDLYNKYLENIKTYSYNELNNLQIKFEV